LPEKYELLKKKRLYLWRPLYPFLVERSQVEEAEQSIRVSFRDQLLVS
jgi:hypothetical protein